MLLLTLLICVEQAHVAFTTTPEHVVLTAECDSGVDSILDLNGSTCNNVEVRISGSTIHIACVAEYVGCTPEILDAGLSHFLFEICCDLVHAVLVILDVGKVADKVSVVEAEIFHTKFLHDLEACVSTLLCSCHHVGSLVPGELLCAATELVATLCAKSVPPSHGEFQPFLHRFAEHDTLCVIVAESHRVVALGPLKLDLADLGKILFLFHCIKDVLSY